MSVAIEALRAVFAKYNGLRREFEAVDGDAHCIFHVTLAVFSCEPPLVAAVGVEPDSPPLPLQALKATARATKTALVNSR